MDNFSRPPRTSSRASEDSLASPGHSPSVAPEVSRSSFCVPCAPVAECPEEVEGHGLKEEGRREQV